MSVVDKNFKGMHFHLREDLSKCTIEEIISLLNSRPSKNTKLLSGRGGVSLGELHGIGPVVLKHYLRGGVFRYFVKSLHARMSKARSLYEFEYLSTVRSLGVNAPEPVAAIWTKGFLYQAWLVTREIENTSSLAEISLKQPERLGAVFSDLARQLAILVENRIFHIDLHPGNVLVGNDGLVSIVDFDKAVEFQGPLNTLRDQYVFRWRRAVIKHELPEELSEMFCFAMRQLAV